MAQKDIDYSLLPEHLRAGMQRYIEQGILPGHFLRAILSNDLADAFLKADDISTAAMRDIAMFVYRLPDAAWGSEEKMLAWAKAAYLRRNPE